MAILVTFMYVTDETTDEDEAVELARAAIDNPRYLPTSVERLGD